MRLERKTQPVGVSAPVSRCVCCGIPSSTQLCLKCATYGELGHTVARMADVMRTLERFGAHDPIPKLPVRVCDLPEAEGWL